SVNAKGLELRLRLPPGWDVVEAPVRMLAVEKLARGTIHGNLTVTREGVPPVARVNDAVLQAVLETLDKLSGRTKAAPPSLDGILALKCVNEIVEQTESEEELRAAEAAVIDGFSTVLASLTDMRRSEGKILDGVLKRRLDEIAALVARAEAAPGRRPQAIKARLAEQVAALIETSGRFDSDRLHQEAVLIAAKADIREELDRLSAHVAQAR